MREFGVARSRRGELIRDEYARGGRDRESGRDEPRRG